MSDSLSIKNYPATLVLVILLGVVGGHRFYVGKIGTGILYFLTAGLLGIGWIIDIITVATGTFTDKTGRFVRLAPRM
jgi:TM2 domain-containing membrane protein YozV